MILSSTETHEIKKVFLIIKGHIDSKLLENSGESLVTNQIVPPILELSFAFEAEPVEDLGLDIVAFQQLQHSREQMFRIAGISVDSASQTVEDHVLLLCCVLKIANE